MISSSPTRRKMQEEAEVMEQETPVRGDILETILTRVPLIDLVSACKVSKSWSGAVSASLRRFNKIKPWLFIRTQRTRLPHSTTAHAYDPRSELWVEIREPSIQYTSALRSSHSTLLYMISRSEFSFSSDPLHLTWHHAKPPRVWRTDPVVAMLDSRRVVVAGGACDFEDYPLAVEMYDLGTRKWSACRSMPVELKESASATWLSAAVNGSNRMYLTEKSTGVTYSFDADTNSWSGPQNVRQPRTSSSFIGFSDSRLILVGASRKGVRLWELDVESLQVLSQIGEMPRQLMEKLVRDDSEEECCWFDMSSMNVSMIGNFVYMYNASSCKDVVVCEVGEGGGGGGCRWSSVKNSVVGEENLVMDRLVFTCAAVSLGDLQMAMGCENRKFRVKQL